MRALVTGSSGFVGYHISKELRRRGWYVVGVDVNRHPREGSVNEFHYEGFSDFIQFNQHQFDLVVHCAYEIGGRAHIDGKNLALAHNLELDAVLFDWAARTEQKAVLYFSSCAAYPIEFQNATAQERLGPSCEDAIDISYPDSPYDNYGWAKLTGERLGKAAAEVGLRVHTVRPFSGYSETQSLDYPFPSIVQRARKGDLSVWGPPGQCRDWIHISDVVNGALAVYEADYRKPVNLCTGVGTEMGDLARKVWDQATDRGYYGLSPVDTCPAVRPRVQYLTDKPTGPLYRVGDSTLMNTFYVPKISLEEGIEQALRG